ncbi:MAG TPA: translation initiation factor IF-2 N-terminal domain-containing protein, partial [Candidatus Binatia bacterium]
MGKTRVHLLAKELGIETKDLVAQLDRLGLRGRKAQSALEDDEVARVRAALAAQQRPQVHVGEEKVVADRVVKSEEEGDGGAEARETIVERRVRANVIRRRTSRTEVAPTETATAAADAGKAPVTEPSHPAFEPVAPVAPAEEYPVEFAPEITTPPEPIEPPEASEQGEAAPQDAAPADGDSAPSPTEPEPDSPVAAKTADTSPA